MNSNNRLRGGALLLACAAVCAMAHATTQAASVVPGQDASAPGDALGDASTRRSVLTNGAADEPQSQVNGSVAELQQMIHDGKVMEMRTTYNAFPYTEVSSPSSSRKRRNVFAAT
jgi:Protein of unknown function (DUF2968)